MADLTPVTISVQPVMSPEEEIVDSCEGLAWEHATTLASAVGMELGSEQFTQTWEGLHERYMDVSHHMAFLQHTALRTLEELFATGELALLGPAHDTDSVTRSIQSLAQVMTASLIWTYTSRDVAWICNHAYEELPEELISVDFTFGGSVKVKFNEHTGENHADD